MGLPRQHPRWQNVEIEQNRNGYGGGNEREGERGLGAVAGLKEERSPWLGSVSSASSLGWARLSVVGVVAGLGWALRRRRAGLGSASSASSLGSAGLGWALLFDAGVVVCVCAHV